ncbi:MAG TPA: hypothetical protein VG253_06615 [Streptosporangiaceae bacterium]|nr:hypothetical protein [Streptosporangiaceae bacterium]
MPEDKRLLAGILGVATLAVVVLIGWLIFGGNGGSPSSAGQHATGATAGRRSATTGAATAHRPGSKPATGGAIAVAPAARQARGARQVATFLGRYFRAINTRNYPVYASLFEPRERPTHQQFVAGFRTTRDSGATLTGLAPYAHGPAAVVTFASHQKPYASPNHAVCDRWNITFFLRPHGSGYLIGAPPRGYHGKHTSCG